MPKEGEGNKILYKWLLIMAVFLIVIVIVGGSLEVYGYFYRNKIYPGVKIGGLELGGKTRDQARVLLQAQIDELAGKGIDFEYLENKASVSPVVYGGGSGAVYELWTYDLDKSVNNIYRWGRGENFWQGIGEKIRTIFGGKEMLAEYKINEVAVEDILREKFGSKEEPGQSAKIYFVSGVPMVEEEKFGRVIDYAKALVFLKDDLGKIGRSSIKMELIPDNPELTKQEVEKVIGGVSEILDLAPVVLYRDKNEGAREKWTIKKQELQDWLAAKKDISGEVYLGLNKELVKTRLEKVAKEVDQPAKEARFKVEGGRVQEFQASEDGEVLDIDETMRGLENKIFQEKKNEVALIMSVDKSKITNESVNDLGIKEMVGSGLSDFGGSPVNRRHNIAVGAGSLNGILIKPEEEFSLLAALGEINAESGYKTELVIKEGKTIPEYGGGLCQIGTTLFRLAVNTGLPITERRNHSYRVSYYEPAGTDATIYSPWPDFKFVNDTGSYLLLQTKIDGNKLFFDFWGTRDGRAVATTSPVIYNIVRPGPTKIIESESLKPGEKKCTEKAHNGADAYFKRTITWPEGVDKENTEETFQSHYVPWSEVCLVGKVATSTAEVIGE